MKKKFTMLFAALLACVGVAKADVTDVPEMSTEGSIKWYTISNTRSTSGKYLYWTESGVKDANTLSGASLFYFTGDDASACYIHNAATDLLFTGADAWDENGVSCKISETPHSSKAGVAIEFSGTSLNENNYNNGFTTWSANDAGSIFVIAPATVSFEEAIARLDANKAAGNTIMGEYKYEEESYNNLVAALAALNSATGAEAVSAFESCVEFMAGLTYVMPEEGKFYVIEAPLFAQVQGVSKGLNSTPGWSTIDLTDTNYYWQVEIGDGGYALKNVGTGTYLGGTTMSETAVYGALNPLGEQQFNIVVNGTTVHANNHGSGANASGNIVSWSGAANSASAWRFVQKNDPTSLQEVVVKYSFTYGGEEKYTQEVNTLVGEEWPAITMSFPYGVSSATKPAGEVTAEGAVEGVVTKTIELAVNLPFTYASDYASIEHWYYMNIRDVDPTYLAYDPSKEYIPATASSIPDDGKDNYTWAFIGDPFNGFQIVNYAAGNTMVLSSPSAPTGSQNAEQLARMVAKEGATGNTTWMFYSSTHNNAATNSFYIQHPTATAYAFNRQDYNSAKTLCYWNLRDTGSAVQLVERPMGPVAELAALIEEIEAAGIVCGTNPGEYTEASVNKLNEAVATAKTVGSSATENDLNDLQTAYNALDVNPITAGMYRIVSAYSAFSEQKGITCYAHDEYYRNRTNPGWAAVNENDPLQYWVLEDAGNGTFNLKAAYEGNYITTATSMSEVAKAATFTLLGKAQFNITLAGDEKPLHCNGWNWDNTTQAALTNWNGGVDSPSAWKLVTVSEEPEFTLDLAVGEVGYATLMLAYNATIPTGATCYTAAVDGEYVKLTEVEGNVLPAKTPVIVAAEANTYSFVSTTATAAVSAENELVGSLYPQIVTPDANTTCYVLAKPAAEEGEEENPVGFYKAALNQSSNAAFLNNANKVYLPVAAGTEAPAMFSFGRGEGTTGIETAVSGEQTVVIYDLAGRRVEKMEKGIYIVNGKKVVK